MDAGSVESGLYVASDGVLVSGTTEVLSDNQTIRFTADEAFAEGAYVQVFLENLATDDSGNAAFEYNGYFRMGSRDERVGQRAEPQAYSPYNNQSEVALNPLIMVRYNEPLDEAALGSAIIELRNTLTNEITSVSTELDSTGYTLHISPDQLLDPEIRYRVYLDEIVDNDGDTNTSNYIFYFTTGADAVEDDRSPMVLAMSPPDGSVDVGLNGAYSVRFDERMNPLSFESSNSGLINVQFSEDNRVVRYDRQGTLEPSSEVTETVPVMFDLSGNEAVSVSSTFTTAASPDFTRGTAVGSVSGSTSTNPVVAWVFSEPVDPVSVSATGVYLRDNLTGETVASSLGLSSDGRRLDIVPEEALSVGRSYNYYAYYLRDLSGNAFNNAAVNFTTDFAEDETPPQVLDATVFEGQTGVPTNGRFNVRFDESMSQLVTLGISLSETGGDAQAVSISFNTDRSIVTVTPQQLLNANSSYTLSVSGMEDIAGNAQEEDLVVTFTTGDTVDIARGSVSSWLIANNAVDVAQNVQPSVTLNERIDPTSINGSSFYLYNNTERRAVPGSWTLDATGVVLTFIPAELLEADHQYYLYVGYSPYLYDLSGNRINNTNRYFRVGEE
jgi:hypothetical protein